MLAEARLLDWSLLELVLVVVVVVQQGLEQQQVDEERLSKAEIHVWD